MDSRAQVRDKRAKSRVTPADGAVRKGDDLRADGKGPRWHRWLAGVIVLAGIAAYFSSFDGVFLFDDDKGIVKNEGIRTLWPCAHLLSTRRPVVELSLAVNYALGRLDVWGYHALNLAIHILAGLTLYGICRRSLGRSQPGDEPARASPWLALAIALVWVVHPLQTQSVTYIIQRSEALMGLFYLLTFYCVIRGNDSPRKRWWYCAAVLACALGMGSKAVMVTAPLIVLLYDRAFLAGSFSQALRRRWGLHIGLGASWVVLLWCGVVQGVLDTTPQTGRHVGFAFKGVTPWEYLLSQPGVIIHYLRLSLWPHPLCLDYYWPAAGSIGAAALPLILIVVLLAGTLWAMVRKPRLGFAGACFFLILAPTSSFIPIKDLAFEHRMYLPAAAVIALVVVGVHQLLMRLFGGTSAGELRMRVTSLVLLVITVAALGFATIRRNRDYHSAFDMWSSVIAVRPDNPRAHSNLAIAFEARGRLDEAERSYLEAIRLDPDHASAYSNLGTILSRQGRTDEAIANYREALRIDPAYVFARTKLGEALVRAGLADEGMTELRTAAQHSPGDPLVRFALGNAASILGDLDGAIEYFREALRLQPTFARAHHNLANMLLSKGQVDQAIDEYRAALYDDPALGRTRDKLCSVLISKGRFDEAINEFRLAVRRSPGDISARFGLADALAKSGKFDESIKEYRELLRREPGYAEARYRLALALLEVGKRSEAITELREAVRLRPDHVGARSVLDTVLKQEQVLPGG